MDFLKVVFKKKPVITVISIPKTVSSLVVLAKFVWSLIVLTWPLAVLVYRLVVSVCTLVVPVVLSVGLFITDRFYFDFLGM